MKKKKISKFGKKQVFLISADPYRQDICVVINGQFSDAEKLLTKFKSKASEENLKHIKEEREKDKESYNYFHEIGAGKAQCYTELPYGYVIVVSHTDSWIETIDPVIHECLHITSHILRRAGIQLTSETEEAYTYLQAKMVKDIMYKLY